MRDLYKEIKSSLGNNLLRTCLTGFSMAWGIFMLIALLGAGNGLLNATMKGTSQRIDNSISVYPGWTSKPYGGYLENRPIRFTQKDIEALTDNPKFSKHIDEITPLVTQGATITYKDKYSAGTLVGGTATLVKITSVPLLHGRYINENDDRLGRKVILLSNHTAKKLLGHDRLEEAVGEYFKVNGIPFKAVGIYYAENQYAASQVLTPLKTLSSIWNKGHRIGNYQFIFHGLETEEENTAFDNSIREDINLRHGADPTDMSTAFISNMFLQNIAMDKVTSILKTALWILGLLSLVSGVVGVSNIMLISVKERTHEFGIRKAIGAKPASILRSIIAESIIITTFFGYIGMILGLAANEIMDRTLGSRTIDAGFGEIRVFENPFVGLDVAFGALAVMIIAGTVAGLIPALKASNVKPIEALRAS